MSQVLILMAGSWAHDIVEGEGKLVIAAPNDIFMTNPTKAD